jgi:hypothetical protein
VFGQKIDVQLIGVFHEVPARTPVTFDELVEELLEADFYCSIASATNRSKWLVSTAHETTEAAQRRHP